MTKLEQWRRFSKYVESHIVDYVVPQYGDLPDAMVEKFTPEKIQGKLEHYVARIGKSSRGAADGNVDCLKIAHFACYLFSKLIERDVKNLIKDIE